MSLPLRLAIVLCCPLLRTSAAQTVTVNVDWSNLSAPTRTELTLQVVENPPLLRGSSIHDAAWDAFGRLHAKKARLALWYPYPHSAVAELQPPAQETTSWDFKYIDPIVEDFFAANGSRPSVFTMSTIPSWMFAKGGRAYVPGFSEEAVWDYEDGGSLRDATGREAAQYFARIASWYTTGGFTDELGRRHISGHRFPLAYWEVLNEPEYEHQISIKQYTRLFDEVSSAIHRISPGTRFVGLSLAEPMTSPDAFTYFLDPHHHQHNAHVDAISYHFYAKAEPGESPDAQQYSFFAQADGFLESVRYIESIRKRLSPQTETHINEVGCISATDVAQGAEHMIAEPSETYLRLCAATFAYLYAGLATQGINVIAASQLLGYPSQYPSVSLLDWKTGKPNARYLALDLLHRNLMKGDRPAKTSTNSSDVFAAAYRGPSGAKKILLINKRDHLQHAAVQVAVGAASWELERSSEEAASSSADGNIELRPFEIVILKQVNSSAANK